MYANGKMGPIETIPGMGGSGGKENDGGGESNYHKNFCKPHKYPSTTAKIF
jgi:hypothetical protein